MSEVRMINAKRYEKTWYLGKLYERTEQSESLAVSDEDRLSLADLRDVYVAQTVYTTNGPFSRMSRAINLGYFTPEQLQAICEAKFTRNVDFKIIDTSPNFTSIEMNQLHPGAVDAPYWRSVFSNQSLLWSQSVEQVQTSIGTQIVTTEIHINTGMEDLMTARTLSQGINLQNIYIAENTSINPKYKYRYNPVNNPINYDYLE